MKEQLTISVWGRFRAIYSVPVIYLSILSPTLHCQVYWSFIDMSSSWVTSVLQLRSSPSYVLAVPVLVPFQTHLRISINILQALCCSFAEIAWTRYIKLGRNDIMTVLSLLIHQHGISFHLFSSLILLIRVWLILGF